MHERRQIRTARVLLLGFRHLSSQGRILRRRIFRNAEVLYDWPLRCLSGRLLVYGPVRWSRWLLLQRSASDVSIRRLPTRPSLVLRKKRGIWELSRSVISFFPDCFLRPIQSCSKSRLPSYIQLPVVCENAEISMLWSRSSSTAY